MKIRRYCLCLLCLLILLAEYGTKEVQAQNSEDSLPAFPGAEGFGCTTPGGRGGRVIKVTNLNTSGPGSLQEACSTEGPRIVVFDTSGVIPADVIIDQSRITIAGQTAPGAGITIRGRLMTRYSEEDIFYEDIVVRFLRVRPNPATGVSGDAIQFSKVKNCVIDHVSCSWANDETIDIYYAHAVTIQWCTIEESDTEGHSKGVPHNYGMINGPGGGRISLHHTLFAHHRRRCPVIAHGPSDIRNIVVYNFRDGLSHEGHVPNNLGFNIIGNYYKTGPSEYNIFPFNFVPDVSYYLRDNYFEGLWNTYTGMIQDPWAEADSLYGLRYYKDNGVKAETEYDVPAVTTDTPQEAYNLIMLSAGCFPRDTVSRRTIVEVEEGTGSWGRHESGDLMTGLVVQTPPIDSDNDGIMDAWERANGLDPSDSTDHNTIMESGYTAIEEYCNMLAQSLLDTRSNLPPLRYDFTGDLRLSIADAVSNILLSFENPLDPQLDVNGDGGYSITDVIRLLLIIRENN